MDSLIVFFSSIFGSAVGIASVGFLSKAWLETRIKESIKHEYDLKIEEIRETALKKAKAEIVAELFAEWLSFPEDQRRLNKLSLQAFLWLPDDLLRDLSNVLAHKESSSNVRDLVIRARKHLLGASDLAASEVIIFTQSAKAKMAARHKVEPAGGAMEEEVVQSDNAAPVSC